MNNNNEKPTSSDEEFKFFDTIESTIIGIFAFTRRFLYTTYATILTPVKLGRHLTDRDRKLNLSRPYTFLVLSLFIGGISIRNLIALPFGDSRADRIEHIRHEIDAVSVVEVLKAALPALVIVLVFGLILRTALAKKSYSTRNLVLPLVFYSVGAQFIVITIFALFGEILYVISTPIGLPIFIYVLFLPAMVIYFGTYRFLDFKYRITHPAFFLACFLFGLLVFVTSALASGLAHHAWEYLEPEKNLLCEEGDVTFSRDESVIRSTVIVTNTTSNTYFINRENNRLFYENFETLQFYPPYDMAPIRIASWSASASPVLSLAPGESAWLKIEADFQDEITYTMSSKTIVFSMVLLSVDSIHKCEIK